MPIGPIGGALLAAAIQAIFGIGGTLAQNAYNSPRAMKRRLRAAGLPLAYMYKGNVSAQGDIPKLSIDPTLGVAPKLQLTTQKRLADAQIPKILEETEAINIANQLGQDDLKYLLNRGEVIDGEFLTNNQINLMNRKRELQAVRFIREHEQRLKQIQRIVENKLLSEDVPAEERRQALLKIKQQIKNMVAQEGLMEQMGGIRQFEEYLNTTFTENLKSLPAWAQAILTFILKITNRININ